MSYLTQDDRKIFGDELLDVAQRSALHVMAPELARLEDENAQMRARLMRADKRSIDQALDQAIPNWRVINNDPRFHQWLREGDTYSRVPRQRLLNEAAERGDANRVVAFFHGFLSEGTAPLGPTRYPSSAATIYTRAEITKMAALRRQGKIDDQAWARWEHEMVAAGREGRIAGALSLDGR